jgi:hypothetical protein
MAILVVCPACGGKLNAPSSLLGRMAKCPKCGQAIKVVANADSPAAAAPRPTGSAQKSSRKNAPPAEETRPTEEDAPSRPASPRKPKTLPSDSVEEDIEIKVVAQDGEGGEAGDFEKGRPASRLAYGFAIPALILGLLGLSFSMIPLIRLLSIPFSGLGLLLGIAGLVVAINQRGRGVLLPSAGSAVSLGALVVGIFCVYWFGFNGSIAGPKSTEAAAIATEQEPKSVAPRHPSPHKAPTWVDASKRGVQQGDIRVEIGGVAVRNVKVKDVLGEESVSPTKTLTIQVVVSNTSPTRKIDFLGWSGAVANPVALSDLLGGGSGNKANAAEGVLAAGRNAAILTDDVNNSYKRITLELGGQILGQINTATSIYPGSQVEDLLVFEPPIENVQALHLELPAGAFGGTGSLYLKIPKAMIQR